MSSWQRCCCDWTEVLGSLVLIYLVNVFPEVCGTSTGRVWFGLVLPQSVQDWGDQGAVHAWGFLSWLLRVNVLEATFLTASLLASLPKNFHFIAVLEGGLVIR